MPELTKTETKALRPDFLFMFYEECKAIAARCGMTDTILWSINFKAGETTSNAMAPLKHRLRARLNGLPLLMFGVIVPAGGGIGHRHGHGVLFLPEGLRDTLKAATRARNANLPRSYQFQPPDLKKGGVSGWIEYCASSRNGSKNGAKFHKTYGVEMS